jgi:hypothetical protein
VPTSAVTAANEATIRQMFKAAGIAKRTQFESIGALGSQRAPPGRVHRRERRRPGGAAKEAAAEKGLGRMDAELQNEPNLCEARKKWIDDATKYLERGAAGGERNGDRGCNRPAGPDSGDRN